ncbi:MAG TPA: hypothetical protein VG323_14475 [Thermoanaerobaculia bacterium]|nr:hypothetical protein [Thermoanaerobaculia bacterium]
MELPDLVRAVLAGDLITARQWVADAYRSGLNWEEINPPEGLDNREMSVAAGIAELLALRRGATPPRWARTIGASTEPLILDPGLEQMPRSFARAKREGPEPLRKRNLVALPDFLDVR